MLGHNRDRRMITIVFDIVFLACFFCAATVTAFASSGKIDVSPDNMAYISVIYGVVCSVSLILLPAEDIATFITGAFLWKQWMVRTLHGYQD